MDTLWDCNNASTLSGSQTIHVGVRCPSQHPLSIRNIKQPAYQSLLMIFISVVFWYDHFMRSLTHLNGSICQYQTSNNNQQINQYGWFSHISFVLVRLLNYEIFNIFQWGNPLSIRLEICQKIYTTGFFGQQFYTLKVRKLWRFSLKKKQRKCINIGYFSIFFC